MNYDRTYRPVPHVPAPRLRDADGSMRPHTYGVRVCSCAAIATEPCRPTACAGESPCCTFTHPATANYSLLTANSSYTFFAKEKDSEAGLSYFGSRYYSSDLSIWLSVDPKSDKYPSMSPYVYCADNPIKLMDPNGEEWVSDKDKQYAQSLIKEAQNRQKQYKSTDNEYKVLQEGIDGLTAMGEEKGQKYGFQKSESTSGCITKKEGVIYMNYIEHESFSEQKDASAH